MINKTNFPDWMLNLKVTQQAIKDKKEIQESQKSRKVNERDLEDPTIYA